MHSSLGAYTKGLRPGLMMQDLVFLACSIPVLWAVSTIGLRKQEE
jgi:ribosome-dependent ATPase